MKFTTDSTLFCSKGKNSCCPLLTKIADDEFHLTDDFGGKVTITKDELHYMAENFEKAVKHLDKNI